MTKAPHPRKASLLQALLLCGAVAVGPAYAAPAAAPDAGSPAVPADMPPVVLSTPAVEAASAFRAYERHAAAISANFTNGPGVEQSLAVGAAFEPKQLARGEVAYAALVALQDPTFVAAVRVYAKDPDQRRDLAQRIEQEPRYAGAFNGSANAAGLIVATLAADTGHMTATGAAVKQSAYGVQHFAWSKSKITDPAGRLARTKALSAAIMAAVPEDVTLLKASEGAGVGTDALQPASLPADAAPAVATPVAAAPGADSSTPAVARALGVHGQPVAGPYAPIVTRGLAVAALAVLGQGGDDNDAAVEALLSEPEDSACLNMSKLNLYQCLAVAGPWYEDVFCLGEHALGETAQCITKETATAAQIQAAMTPPPVAGPTATATLTGAAAAPTAAVTPTALAVAH